MSILPSLLNAYLVLFLYGPVFPVSCSNEFKECGLRNVAGPVANDGHLEYPWHVALYSQSYSTEPPIYICGGTIIHKKIILTAAHCVYDDDLLNIENKTFVVAAGKYNSSFDFREPTEQRFEIVKIKIPESYFGRHALYKNNIAALILNESINFSNVVKPACIDWNSELHLNLTMGTVVGWGLSDNNALSTELAVAKIEFYNRTTCREKLKSKLPVTFDNFCAAPSNSSALQLGSSGGGFFLSLNSTENREIYYLHGILCLRDRDSHINVLTDLKAHLSWLTTIMGSVTDSDLEVFAIDDGDNVQDCGIRYAVNSHVPTINYGFEARPSEYPWHVALYRQFSSTQTPEYICGGSIVHRQLILTAAHCFYNETIFGITNATYTAVAGKYHRSWDHEDSFEKRFKVVEIKTPETYRSILNRYADDIAILLLNETISFSSFVMPVCIDWNPDLNAQKIPETGTAVGWGLTENGALSAILFVAELKYFNFIECSKRVEDDGFANFLTSDKFCAGLDNGTAVNQGDSGGGLVILRGSVGNTRRYYLRGIVSTKARSDNSIAAFTDINKHLKWLNSTMSPFIGAEYCPRLSSNSIELVLCRFNNTSVNCDRPAKTGTAAKVLCSSSFHSGFPFRLYTETECQKNRTWSPLMESCMECGKRYRFNNFVPAIIYKPRNVSEFPWHVAVYKKNETKYEYFCGGTIIHPKAVLTGAQCVTDGKDGNVYEAELFYVVAGKYKVGWNINDPFEQRFQVYKIYTRSTYTGYLNRYQHDIAVLELNGTISLSDYIMPACIDWTGKLQLHKKPFISAISPGWGLNENGTLSEELRFANLLYVNLTRCYNLVVGAESLFVDFLTSDKWCAISQDGALLDRGDSGGSLTFPRYNEKTGEQTNYIYGLISIRTQYSDIYGITDILFHIEWIKDIMISIIKTNDKGDLNI